MSAFAGPKLWFVLPDLSKQTFDNFTPETIRENVSVLNASVEAGFSITIHRLYVDVTADLGLHNISRSFSVDNAEKTDYMIFNRRRNGLAFSVGLLF